MNETEFYDRLAAAFDVMTDWPFRLAFELPFLETILARHSVHSVLDCAAGTGGHALALAGRGYRVAASDASPVMLARAREKAQRQGSSIRFEVARFDELSATFGERFDAVLCLGNSFVHVLTPEAALAGLRNMRACLRDGGVLVLHNLNYDRRWKERPRWFGVNAGTLEGKETLIWRFADYGTEFVTFNIALFARDEKAGWSVDVQSTPQRPYQKAELEDLLHQAGLSDLQFYGNLKGDPFEPDRSGDLVITAVA